MASRLCQFVAFVGAYLLAYVPAYLLGALRSALAAGWRDGRDHFDRAASGGDE